MITPKEAYEIALKNKPGMRVVVMEDNPIDNVYMFAFVPENDPSDELFADSCEKVVDKTTGKYSEFHILQKQFNCSSNSGINFKKF